MLSRTGCVLTACLIAAASGADAALITVNFTGVVTSGIDSQIAAGSAVSGSYTYESETAGSGINAGNASYYGPVRRFKVGDTSYDAGTGNTDNRIQIVDNAPDDFYYASASSTSAVGITFFQVSVSGGSDLLSSVLITAIPKVSAATDRTFVAYSSTSGQVFGNLTSLAVVPVPAALPLMASAVGALALAGMRRRRTAPEA
jgi:hypothetical protein